MLNMIACALVAAAAREDTRSNTQVLTIKSQTLTIRNGVAENGTYIGLYTSQIQRVVDKYFDAVTLDEIKDVAFVNNTVLRYLHLDGDYLADAPLKLPSLLVLKLNGKLEQAANLTVRNISRFSAMVMLEHASFSAVIGGTYNSTKLATPAGSRGMQAVSIQSGSFCAVRSVRAVANSDSAIGVNMGSGHEVSHCNVGGEPGFESGARCIWTLATRRAIVHDNWVHHCKAHALDFDAYTSGSVCFNNLCEDNGEEGIFVEETANGNVIFNNTCRRNRNGIGVYANAVGPVANNFFVNNIVVDNEGSGITAGGYGHDPIKTSQGNTFIANMAARNGGNDFNPMHGAAENDFWTANLAEGGSGEEPVWGGRMPTSSANVSIFEP